jgi:hypothetical protein
MRARLVAPWRYRPRGSHVGSTGIPAGAGFRLSSFNKSTTRSTALLELCDPRACPHCVLRRREARSLDPQLSYPRALRHEIVTSPGSARLESERTNMDTYAIGERLRLRASDFRVWAFWLEASNVVRRSPEPARAQAPDVRPSSALDRCLEATTLWSRIPSGARSLKARSGFGA